MKFMLADSLQERLEQVEALLYSQVDNSRSSLSPDLCQLIASGGKRLRPRLVLLTGSMLGADDQRLVTLASAIEMLHTATLIHDDLVDNSLLRRGMATHNAHYSSTVTVLAGDFAFARAARLASRVGSLPVMNLFAETLEIMADGELTQASRDQRIVNREDYFRWIHAKTASLFELATGAAALLSPVDELAVASARKFGYTIGMAFQIVDDVLDFTGNPTTLGKTTGSDLRQGVITLPTLFYLETHPEYPIVHLLNHWKDEETGASRLEQLIADIRKNGAIHRAIQEAEGFVQCSLNALTALPDTPERHALAEIARSVVRRDS
jgi:geranylgeranyl pyrophosphate synthase